MTTIQKRLKILARRSRYLPWVGAVLGVIVGSVIGLECFGVTLFAGVAWVLTKHYCITAYKEYDDWRTLS